MDRSLEVSEQEVRQLEDRYGVRRRSPFAWMGTTSIVLFAVAAVFFAFFTFMGDSSRIEDPDLLVGLLQVYSLYFGIGLSFGVIGVLIGKGSRPPAVIGAILNALGLVGSLWWVIAIARAWSQAR